MTNQQLKAHCEDVIANPQGHQDWVVDIARVALASLEAEPVVVRCRYHPTPQCDGKWIYIPQAEYIKDETGKYQEQALYTAPPVPELKLPPRMTNPNQLVTEGTLWNDCLDVIERLNAPHTAPIEPICATGGAEWVSDERVEEIIYRAEIFGHGAGYLPDEVIPMAKELLALRKAFSEPYGWITEYPSIPAGIGGMTYSFHDNRQDAQDEAEAYDGFAVAVIRKP